MNHKEHSWAKWNQVARQLGLSGRDGHYMTRDGRVVDFTATAPERQSFLIRLGQTCV